MIKHKFMLAIAIFMITSVGAFLRFYHLGESPAGIYVDEAGIGYSAYSILKTGRDEYGMSYPIVFRSFLDFKTPVYIYLLVPFLAVMDLSLFTVRFPSFIAGVLTIPLLFLVIRKVGEKYLYKTPLALLSALLLALSPWHILFSRAAFECNLALFLYLLGIYLFFLGLQKPWILLTSAIAFAIALPAYHAERILVPLTILLLGWYYRKTLLNPHYRVFTGASLGVGILITLPTMIIAASPGFLARASGLNIFAQTPVGVITGYQGTWEFLVNGAWFLNIKEFAGLYVSYFSPRSMFQLGDYDLRTSYPDLATFYLWQLPFYLIGIFLLIQNWREKGKSSLGSLGLIIGSLLIISPLPAAVTRDAYTSIRALPVVIPQIVLIALGMVGIGNWINLKARIFGYGVVGGLIIFSLLQLYSSGLVLNNFYRAMYWHQGIEEVADFVVDKYQDIPVVMDNSRSEYYIQMAFFLKHDPLRFQQENFEVTASEYYYKMERIKEKKVGKITFRAINWKEDLKVDQYLIGDALAISERQIQDHHLKLEQEIRYPDQSVAFRIVRTNPEYENQKNSQFQLSSLIP